MWLEWLLVEQEVLSSMRVTFKILFLSSCVWKSDSLPILNCQCYLIERNYLSSAACIDKKFSHGQKPDKWKIQAFPG